MSGAAIPSDIAEQLLEAWNEHALLGATSDIVHHVLRDAIVDKVLPPGQRLGEEPIGALFQVSRTPVREALLRLENENLAKRIPRRGFVVNNITAQEIIDVYVVREVIDALAAQLAAEHATPADLSDLTWINQQFSNAAQAKNLDQVMRLNLQFHEAVAKASCNSLLQDMIQQVHLLVMRFHNTTLAFPGRADEAFGEHAQLIDAITKHDSRRAYDLAYSHMSKARLLRIRMHEQDNRAVSPTSKQDAAGVVEDRARLEVRHRES